MIATALETENDPEDEDEGEFDLDDLLWLISEMPLAVSSLAELLADCVDRDIPADIDRLARLGCDAQDAGLVDIWEDPATGGGFVTLTPLAAGRLGVLLTWDSRRWYKGRDPDPQPPGTTLGGEGDDTEADNVLDRYLPDDLARDRLATVPLATDNVLDRYIPGDEHRPGRQLLDRSIYVDPTQPEPLDILAGLDRRGEPLRDGSSVVVRTVLGLGIAWPPPAGPAVVRIEGDGFVIVREVCRGCGSRRQRRNSYCAICHRAGVDGLLLPVERELQQAPQKSYRPGKLGGGTGKKAGKNGHPESQARPQRQAQAPRRGALAGAG